MAPICSPADRLLGDATVLSTRMKLFVPSVATERGFHPTTVAAGAIVHGPPKAVRLQPVPVPAPVVALVLNTQGNCGFVSVPKPANPLEPRTVISGTRAFCVEPVVPASGTCTWTLPPAPVPVPRDPAIVAAAPAVLLVPVRTFWNDKVCAVGEAASSGPRT